MYALDLRTANAHYPGIGRYTFELARALAPLTELVLIFDPRHSTQEYNLLSIAARRIAVPHSPRSLAQQWVLPERLSRLKPKAYHSPYYLMPYSPGLPTVVTAYDVIPLLVPQGYTAAQRLIYRLAHALAFNAADVVITLSEAARDEFVARFRLPAEMVAAIAPGLTAQFQPPTAEAVAAVRQRYQLPAEYLLYVGSARPHKNLPALIQAYAQLPASPPLVIAGPEDARYPEARRAAATLGERVRFLGRMPDDDLPPLYGGATLYVHPSLLEGFGFPVLEALGCGVAVACSDIPALRELAQNAAVYFDPRQPASITQTLAETLENAGLLTALRERSLLRARYFSWERAAAQTLEVYQVASGEASS